MNAIMHRAESNASRAGIPQGLAEALAPLERLAQTSPSLLARPLGTYQVDGRTYALPRYQLLGPQGGDAPIHLGLFAGLHGDEPAGVHALVALLTHLEAHAELAQGYVLSAYPICNPTGFEDGTRLARSGRDLNREFWRDSREPEVRLLEAELGTQRFQGLIALHSDDTSDGLYGYVRGALLTQHLIEPALRAAEAHLPRNEQSLIDGFNADRGVIRDCFPGVLSAPPERHPQPFDIILETPQRADPARQEQALVAALLSILAEYRALLAYAPNL